MFRVISDDSNFYDVKETEQERACYMIATYFQPFHLADCFICCGHWANIITRPPIESSPFSRTHLHSFTSDYDDLLQI
jgi:hypothetical protein